MVEILRRRMAEEEDHLSLELLLCCGRVQSAEGSGGADPIGLCGMLSLEPAERRCLMLGLSTNREIG